jgi:hypothetical protein
MPCCEHRQWRSSELLTLDRSFRVAPFKEFVKRGNPAKRAPKRPFAVQIP